MHGQRLRFRQLCPQTCGICHLSEVCTLNDADEQFATLAASLGFASNYTECHDGPAEFCSPASKLGTRLGFRELCPATCGRCTPSDAEEANPWVSVEFVPPLGETCDEQLAASVAAQFQSFLTQLGVSKENTLDVASGCGTTNIDDNGAYVSSASVVVVTTHAWVRSTFESVQLAKFALLIAAPAAVVEIGGVNVKATNIKYRSDLAPTTQTSTVTTTTATPKPCEDDDEQLAVIGASLSFSTGALKCSNPALSLFCDEDNALGKQLTFRLLCPASCGVCTAGSDPAAATTTIATIATTVTVATCNDNDAQLAIAGSAFSFASSGSLKCGNPAMSSFCDRTNPLGNKISFRTWCPATCGLCIASQATAAATTTTTTAEVEDACNDKNAECGSWVDLGFCISSRTFMLENCRAKCKFCGDASGSTTSSYTTKAVNLLDASAYHISGAGATYNALDGSVVLRGSTPGFKWTLADNPQAPSVATSNGGGWTVGFEATQAKGTGGYVFAKTDSSGNRRHLALYSGSNGLTAYYTVAGRSANVVLSFKSAGAINDGKKHDVVVWGEGYDVGVRIDSGAPSTRTLDGGAPESTTLFDCGSVSADCIFSLGQRANGSGGSTSHSLTGSVHTLVYTPNKAIRTMPFIGVAATTTERFSHIYGSDGTVGVDWLDPNNHDAKAPYHGGTGAYGFMGSSRLKILTPVLVPATASFTVGARVQVGEGTGGYVFAKTSRSGKTRYFALYVSKANKDVVLYYTPVGQKRQSIRFEVDLTTGGDYRILLSVENGAASFFVDDIRVGPPRDLWKRDGGSEGLRDCGNPASNCILLVGQRSSTSGGTLGMRGFVRQAFSISGVALSSYPKSPIN